MEHLPAPPHLIAPPDTCIDETSIDGQPYHSTIVNRRESFLHNRYIYTYSEYSSSISSLSTSNIAAHRTGQHQQAHENMAGWQTKYFRLDRTKLSSYLRVFASLLIIMHSAGLCLIHGIFESDYEVDFAEIVENKEMGRSRTAVLIGALQLSVYIAVRDSGVGFVIGRLLDIRIGVVASAILCSGGLLASSYAGSVWQLCLAQGLMVGLGAALGFSAASDMLDHVKASCSDWAGLMDTTALAVAATGAGGGVLALVTRTMVASGSTATALRWLALVVLCSQLLGAALMGSANSAAREISRDIGQGMGNNKGKQIAADDSDTAGLTAVQYHHQSPTHLHNIGPFKKHASRLFQALKSRRFLATLLSDMLHHTGVFVPPILLPGYASTQLPESNALSGALLLSLIWFTSSLGSILISICKAPVAAMAQNTAQILVSLSIWCLWLPAADSWAMVYAFCVVYGLSLGVVFKQKEDDQGTGDLISAWVRALGCAASVMVGVPVAGWLFVGFGSGTLYVPAVAFAAATSLGAAVVSCVAKRLLEIDTK